MNLTTMKQTMSSREIATLTGKEHRNVKRDIENMLQELALHCSDLSSDFVADNGQTYQEYSLPKRECLILVSGYNVKMRAAIIDRWQELENVGTPQIPLTPDGIARQTIEDRLAIGKLLGTEDTMSKAIAIQRAEEVSGVDLQPYQRLLATLEKPMTPTQVGEKLTPAITASKVNALLAVKGLQEKIGKEWIVTEKGKEYCTLNPYKSRNSDHNGYRPLWFSSVIRLLTSS